MSRGWTAAAFCVLLCGRPAGAQDAKRILPPDAAAEKEATKIIRDIFKEDYAKPRPEHRLALAQKLLQQGVESKDDPASRFVLFKETQDIALQIGDLALALKAVRETARYFEVDGFALQAAAIGAAEKTAKTPAELKSVAGAHLSLAEDAIRGERFDVAEKATQAVSSLGKKVKDLPLISKADAKSKEIAAVKLRAEKVKKARETLAATPADPAANLAVGQFECFTKRNWELGLPLLAKGSDAALRTLAENDMKGPGDPPSQMAVADAWWSLGEKETGAARENLREHAGRWYEKAASGLSGLAQAKAEMRLSEVRNEKLMKGTWIDITDPAYLPVAKKGDALVLDAKEQTQASKELNTLPSGEYDGFSVRLKFVGARRGQAWMRFEDQKRLVWINAEATKFTAISRSFTPDWVTDFDQPCPPGDEYVVTVLLDQGQWVAYVNGKEMTRLKASLDNLKTFGLVAYKNKVAYDRILLRKKE